MKKIFGLFALALVAAGFTSCDYDSDDDSYVTHYVNIELTGGSTYSIPVGSTYTDPGYKATEGTEDVTSKVVVGGDVVDGNALGIYNVTYSAPNRDGFSASTERQVLVYDPEVSADISGTYTITNTAGSGRIFSSYSVIGNTVTITQLMPGLYTISDYWGGLYDQTLARDESGYRGYVCSGTFSMNKDNVINGISSSNPWNLPMESVTGSYDPATGSVQIDASINYHLVMTLEK